MSNSELAIARLALLVIDSIQQKCSIDLSYANGWVYETTVASDLFDALAAEGISTAHQVNYPGSRKSCDIVSTLDDANELWLEVKLAWLITHPFIDENGKKIGGKRNGQYKKHMFHPDEYALRDLTQKQLLISGSKKYYAFLLVGFDSIEMPMDADIAELSVLSDLAIAPWTSIYRGWPHPQDCNYRIRCWFWYRSIPELQSHTSDS